MQLLSSSFGHEERIPTKYALAIPADPGPVTFSGNRNPQLSWSDVPEGTRSYVVTCIDHDCPSAPDDVNQPDREVPSSLPRVDFTHWLLANVPGTESSIAEGSHSEGVTARGKTSGACVIGIHGRNDYTSWFSGDPDLDGTWNGYDGPAPPWNDSVAHRYEFTVYALDVEELDLPPGFSRDDLTAAMEGHVLDSESIIGTYAINPRLH